MTPEPTADDMLYFYRASLVRVVDGDTVHMEIDEGFEEENKDMILRLYGINAPEMTTAAGKVAKQFAIDWFAAHPNLIIKSYRDKTEKYGRYLATIFDASSLDPATSLNQALLDSGNAVPYMVSP